MSILEVMIILLYEELKQVGFIKTIVLT